MIEPQVRGMGETYSGYSATGSIPELFLKRGIDRMGEMAFITKGMNKLLFSISTRWGKAKVVNTREHKVLELSELDRKFFATVPSVLTGNPGGLAHNRFGISNQQAAQLQVNDMLYALKTFAYVDGIRMTADQIAITPNTVLGPGQSAGTINSNPVNIGPALNYSTGFQPTSVIYTRTWGLSGSNYITDNEPLKIEYIDAPNSAGPGNTFIVVRRCYVGPHAMDQGGRCIPLQLVNNALNNASTVGDIRVGDEFVRGLPIFREGTNAPNGLHKNPIVDNNFTQEFKYAVEKTKESDIEQTWLEKDPLSINRLLTTRRGNMDQERTYLMGRKNKEMDKNGRVEYAMGGVFEFIKKDKDHILTYLQPSLTYQGWLDIGNQVFQLGGSEERDCYCGYTLYTEIKKAFFASGYLRYDPDASKNFDIPVESILTVGGKLNIIPLYTMEEIGWGKRMLCLDMGVPSFVPVTHEGWDMKTEKDIQDIGSQMYKEQIIGIKGLERRYQDYHAIIDFPI